MDGNLKQKVISGVIWRSVEQFGIQIVNFIVAIVLARLLGPDAFGTIALLTIFIALSEVIANAGFGQALIQKKNADDLDFNSVFYFSCVIGICLYFVLFFIAPHVAVFYNLPILKILLRVLALRVIVDMIASVQNSYLSRNMLFKKSFIIAFPSIVFSAIVGICLAIFDFGVWALVWSTLAGCLLNLVLKWLIIGWRPSLQFSFLRLRMLWGFGSKILISNFLDTFFSQLYSIVIGKVYTKEDLAFYNRGDHIPKIGMTCIQGAISSVIFPAFSKIQNDTEKLKEAMHKTMRIASMVVSPIMIGLAMMSRPIILVLLGEKWEFAVPFMQIACFIYVFWPMYAISLQSIQALGRSDIFLKLEIYKKIILLIVLVCTCKYGVIIIALGRLITSPLSMIINVYPNKKLIGYSFKNLFCDLKAGFILSLLVVVFTLPILFLPIPDIYILLIQSVLFLFAIAIALKFLKLKELDSVLLQLKSKLKTK